MGQTRRDLYLQVSGDVGNLTAAMKAGRSALLTIGAAANDVQAEVDKAFADMGANAPAAAKQIERSYQATFNAIRQNAKAVLEAPSGKGALAVLDATAAAQAAKSATAQATALREVADAAERVAQREGEAGGAARVYATAAAANAELAEREATGLRAQAEVLGKVRQEITGVADASGKGTDATEAGTKADYRAVQAKAMLQHNLRAIGDSFASGTPLAMIFGQHIGSIAEMMALYGQSLEHGAKKTEEAGEATHEAGVDIEAMGEKLKEGGEQASHMGGKLAAVGEFLGGPWGFALLAATTLLTPFVAKLFETGDETEKLIAKLADQASKAEAQARANDIWAHSVDGVAAATKGAREELDKLLTSQSRQLAQKGFDQQAVIGTLESGKGGLNETNAALKAALAELRNARATRQVLGNGPGTDAQLSVRDRADAAIAAAEARVAALQTKVAGLRTQVNDAQRALLNVHVLQAKAEIQAGADASSREEKRWKDAEDALDVRRQELGEAAYRREYQHIFDLHQAKLKAIKDEKAAATPSLGSQLDAERGARLLASAQGYTGLNENSAADRTKLHSIFAAAGASNDIDAALKPWCAAFVNGILAASGLPGTGALSARSFLTYGSKTEKPDKGDIVVLRTGKDQEHVGFYAGEGKGGRILVTAGNQSGGKVSTTSFPRSAVEAFRRPPGEADVEKSREAADRKREEQAKQAAENDRAYQAQLAQAQSRVAHAVTALADTAENRYELAIDELTDAQTQRDKQIDDQVLAGKLTEAQAKQLHALNLTATLAEKAAAVRAEEQAILDRQLEAERLEAAGKLQLLQLQGDLATTAKERRRIALKILAIEEDEARAAATRDMASNDPERQKRGAAALKQVAAEHAGRVQQTEERTDDPLQSYFRRITRASGNMSEALKGVKADGVQQLEDGLLGIVTGTETVASAFKKMASAIIADLARIAIEKLIVKTIGAGFFGFADGGLVQAQHHADGGFITGAGSGTSDDILSWLSNGEFVVTAAATRRHLPLLKAMNDNQLPAFATGGLVGTLPQIPTALPSISAAQAAVYGGQQRVHVTADIGVKPSPLFETAVQGVAVRTVGAAAEPIMAGAEGRTMRRLQRAGLPGAPG